MITRWIHRKGNSRVLLFFNGWGMDCAIARYLQSNTAGDFASDVLFCYDYTVPGIGAEVLDAIASYGERTLVAWSLGVWAAAEAGLDGIGRAIAINGTLSPVGEGKGIPADTFHATLEGWSEKGRERFTRRICGGGDNLERFQVMASVRDVKDQKAELAAIGERILADGCETAASWKYTHALIGGRDMIFPPAAQEIAWEGVARTVVPDMPHVPFFLLSGWEALQECSN